MSELVRKQNKMLIQLLIGSESFFFLAMIVGYLYYTVYSPAWENGLQYLNIVKTAIFSGFLIASSCTLMAFEYFSAREKHKPALLFLGITILFGLIFLVGQGLEYYDLFQKEILPSTNIFGSAFFTLTGFHGLHVLIGVISLIILLGLSFSAGTYNKISSAVAPISMYWHFVDAVWIFVFTVVYLLPYLK